MAQIKAVGVLEKIPDVPRTKGLKLPDVLSNILEWQSARSLKRLTDGRYYLAEAQHVNVHSNHNYGGKECRQGDCHSDSHNDNHTDTTNKYDQHVDRGPKPPPEPKEPPDCRGKGCLP